MLKKILFSALKNFKFSYAGQKKDFGITAVCFHRISDEIDYAYPCMPVHTFHGVIEYFSQNYSIILPNDIGKPTPKPKLIITFDDGYKDFYTNALPILIKFNASAIMNLVVDSLLTGENFWTQKISQLVNHKLKLGETLKIAYNDIEYNFTITPKNSERVSLEICSILSEILMEKRMEIIDDLIEKTAPLDRLKMMNTNDVKECLKNNISIGSHSYTHDNLTLKSTEEHLHKEIIESKAILEKTLNTKIESFAFPSGKNKVELYQFLINAGYKNAFTTEDKIYTPIPNSKINVIPRIILYGSSVDENILRTNLFHARIKKILNK